MPRCWSQCWLAEMFISTSSTFRYCHLVEVLILLFCKNFLLKQEAKMIILGIQEKPDRNGHPAYKYIARPETIINPGFGRGFGYFADLLYINYRPLRLFRAGLVPGESGLA